MPFQLASDIIALLALYCVAKDFYWRSGRKGGAHNGPKARKKAKEIRASNIPDHVKQERLQGLEVDSKKHEADFDTKMSTLFEKPTQRREVTSFFSWMYKSEEDAEQQLYYILSFPFATMKTFLKLCREWTHWRKDTGGKIDEYCCVSFIYLMRCGELGSLNVHEMRNKLKFRDGSNIMNVDEIAEHHNFERICFSSMEVEDDEIPFEEFPDCGLRFCTPQIKDAVEKIFGTLWFTLYQMIDLTPKSLFFICLINFPIPMLDFGFVNAPFEAEVAKLIYPKVFLAWRQNRIKQLFFMGRNNWLSKETHAGRSSDLVQGKLESDGSFHALH